MDLKINIILIILKQNYIFNLLIIYKLYLIFSMINIDNTELYKGKVFIKEDSI